MAELRRLLSFMSAWDREAALAHYGTMLDNSEDPDALIEALGTPTKLAIELARTYVPSPAPAELTPEPVPADTPAPLEAPQPPESVVEAPAEIRWTMDAEPEKDAAAEPATAWVINNGALAAYLVPALVIGLPIAVLLVCLGVPFMLAGGTLLAAAVRETLRLVALLPLLSDVLLVLGGALCAGAAGLLLFWLGFWISMELCWLWADKVLLALGRRLCLKEVPTR